MKSDAVQVARIEQNTARLGIGKDLALALLENPVALGFGGLLANHAIYKSGWYKPLEYVPEASLLGFTGVLGPFAKGSAEQDAQHVHDTIALFIMIASIVASSRSGGLPADIMKAVS